MNIKIKKLVGAKCVEPDDGVVVREKIIEAFGNDLIVTLDFEGVSMLISAFLNVAIGSLYKDYEVSLVDSIEFTNLDSSDEALISIVVKNAKKFYGLSDEDKAEIIDQTDDLIQD